MRLLLSQLSHLFSLFHKNCILGFGYFQLSTPLTSITTKNIIKSTTSKEVCLLDLPDLVLESILERLQPSELTTMGSVCRSLRVQCGSDRLWARHLEHKWGQLIGDATYREWQCHVESKSISPIPREKKGLFGYLSDFRPFSSVRPMFDDELRSFCLPVDSVMALYLALENGEFWFPAQVYNRQVENGQVGFMLSCYDAKLNYDSSTDTFRASYNTTSSWSRQMIEEEIEWKRVRVAKDVHISDCLSDLKPGNHFEIQWRRNNHFPYGWWYGVVGHLESCDWEKSHCKCHNSDNVVLEFKQYNLGSRWRQVVVSRKDHRKVGNNTDEFYGGIRKLYFEEEISMWKRFWPTGVME